jgi:predicted nuclease of restriction endonuclease-like (RecB) superfamily
MRDKPHNVRTNPPASDDHAISSLLEQVRALVRASRKSAATAINSLQVVTSYEIGRMIVEHEQQGTRRARYGELVLKTLSERLTSEFGRGFSRRNLEYMRRFFLEYRDRIKQIAQMASAQLAAPIIGQTPSGQLVQTSEKPSRKSAARVVPFALSWSQYIFLLGITNEDERRFYEIEAAQNTWTLPELKRQFNAGLYERLALSRDKAGIRKLTRDGQRIAAPQDMIKDPYVLEFLGLEQKSHYSEHDLETAIIDKLEHFLLELGKGFLFESRQKRFTFGEDHFFVDLVFYNRLLRCYVLIDLKIGKLTHQDLGQMQMYVNYFDRHVKLDHEHSTVGIVLCKKKHDALVELTLPEDANIYASQYQLYLPSKEDLKKRLMQWAQEWAEEGLQRESRDESQ